MILLRFTFRNHRSFRDEAVFDLTRPSLKTLKLPEGTRWADHVHHVDGVYGANASGKSNLLDALSYALRAIKSSASTWLAAPRFPREPFALNPAHLGDPGEYELEFVSQGRRYFYRFSVDTEGIRDESLRVLGKQRWTSLLERTQDGKVARVSGLARVARRELALSRAAEMDHEALAPIRRDLVEGFDVYRVGDREVRARLARIVDLLVEGGLEFDELVALARIADTGITRIRVEEHEVPEELREFFRRLMQRDKQTTQDMTDTNGDSGQQTEAEDARLAREFIARNLAFTHGREGADLRERDESTGTMAWLALGTAVLDALRNGRVLVVDELGAALHPDLSQIIVDWFEDPDVNATGAQLVFTSHDMSLMGTGSGERDKREQVWLVEKDAEGTSELINLGEFALQPRSNVPKQYLEGRFGAVPYTVPSLIHSLLDQKGE